MRIVLMGLAAAAALAASSAAQANPYLATYTGVVSGDSFAMLTDANGEFLGNTNAFGAVNGAFDGATFTLKYRYDTGVGAETIYPGTDNLEGSAPNSPVSWVAITINGQAAGLGPIAHSVVAAYNYTGVPGFNFPDARGFAHQAESYDGLNGGGVALGLINITVNAELDQLFSGAPSGGNKAFSTGSFWLQHYDASSDTYDLAGGSLAATYLTIEAIPEPATWALMLIGFGGLGAALRLRRGSGALAAA